MPSGAVAAVPYANIITHLNINPVGADEFGVHLTVGPFVIAIVHDVSQSGPLHLCHNDVINWLAARYPVRLRVKRIVNLIERISYLLWRAVHQGWRRPGARVGRSVARLNVELDDCAVRLSRHLSSVLAIIGLAVAVCTVIRHCQVCVCIGVVVWE